ncbi:hypothetical protein M0R45_012078 [Rubus argutus]|uniref:Uncharacterized protein n=1 Tax=Rubus argutus TaxID=59490 RepID=A0AAW1YCX0_RUBAR
MPSRTPTSRLLSSFLIAHPSCLAPFRRRQHRQEPSPCSSAQPRPTGAAPHHLRHTTARVFLTTVAALPSRRPERELGSKDGLGGFERRRRWPFSELEMMTAVAGSALAMSGLVGQLAAM